MARAEPRVDICLRHRLFCLFVACCIGSSFTTWNLEGILSPAAARRPPSPLDPGNGKSVGPDVWTSWSQGPKVFVGVFSAYEERRKIWRDEWKCGEQLAAAGIPYKFIVGWPVDKGRDLTVHQQGVKPNAKEATAVAKLRIESWKFGDLQFLFLPDMYLNLQMKTFAFMEYGYRLGASYVMKSDDDHCVIGKNLLKGIRQHEATVLSGSPNELYAGSHGFNGSETSAMMGRDLRRTPYFGGPCYLLSKDLIQLITQDDLMNTVLWTSYGTFDEDSQMGKWVTFAEEEHNMEVDRVQMKGICKSNFSTADALPVGEVASTTSAPNRTVREGTKAKEKKKKKRLKDAKGVNMPSSNFTSANKSKL